ncbi:MAG: hypothetical protein H0X62_06125 [Bacteroidetes bacterium]|nr:hypothetical protein [Bacteroidota bacterium]
MKNLSKNWLTEKLIDFEYKKYILLAYFSEVNQNFDKNFLYPHFSEIIEHYKNLVSLKESKKIMSDAFPTRLSKMNLENFNLEYKKIVQDDELLKEIEQIIDFSIPKFEYYLKEGKNIFDFIENNISVSTVGLVPLNPDFGYLFLNNANKLTYIYEYRTTIFEGPEEKYRGLQTIFVETYKKNFTTTYEFIKTDLLKKKKDLPNPATYAIETSFEVPLHQTLLPVAKRILMRVIG